MTSLWHTSAYPEIENATATGKTVVVTGASSGIGRAAAVAFAKAGASHVALIGRREEQLKETEGLMNDAVSGIRVTIHVVSVKDLEALKKAAKEIGDWDVLVLNAGRIMKPANVEEADPELWWDVFEVCDYTVATADCLASIDKLRPTSRVRCIPPRLFSLQRTPRQLQGINQPSSVSLRV
jgi:hypothetical protein